MRNWGVPTCDCLGFGFKFWPLMFWQNKVLMYFNWVRVLTVYVNLGGRYKNCLFECLFWWALETCVFVAAPKTLFYFYLGNLTCTTGMGRKKNKPVEKESIVSAECKDMNGSNTLVS